MQLSFFLDLVGVISQDPNAKKVPRRLCALAFVSLHEIDRYFEEIANEAPQSMNSLPLLVFSSKISFQA